jgi:hypothetical protein
MSCRIDSSSGWPQILRDSGERPKISGLLEFESEALVRFLLDCGLMLFAFQSELDVHCRPNSVTLC